MKGGGEILIPLRFLSEHLPNSRIFWTIYRWESYIVIINIQRNSSPTLRLCILLLASTMLIVIDGETREKGFNHWRCVFTTTMIKRNDALWKNKIRKNYSLLVDLVRAIYIYMYCAQSIYSMRCMIEEYITSISRANRCFQLRTRVCTTFLFLFHSFIHDDDGNFYWLRRTNVLYTCACCPSPDIVRSSNSSVMDLDKLRAVHGLRYLVRVRAAPAAAMVPAVAATPPAVATRVASPAVPAAAATRVAATTVPVLDLRLLLLFGRLCHSPTHSTDN